MLEKFQGKKKKNSCTVNCGTDDIALVVHDRKTMQKMIDELVASSRKVGLVVNRKKTVTMTNLVAGNQEDQRCEINGH